MNLPRRPLEAMATAPITRHFLGFEEPALESAARYLIGQAPPMADRTLDLSETVVVVPGARAGRQLRNRLLLASESLDKGLLPPRIVTTSHLPELLYEPRRPFASRWIQQLAWTTALARVGPTIRRRIAPRLTAESRQGSGSLSEDWLDVGRMLWRQYRELTAEGLSFADVVEQVESLEGFRETQRWTALAAVQNEYLQALDSEEIWDKQTARLVAIRHEECRFDGHLVLLGAVDLSRTMKEMLSQVAASVTALIFAPPAWESRFDPFGCVDVNAWEAAEVRIPASSWQVAYGPQEQAQQIVDVIREFDGEYAPHEVVVGCADAKLVPFIQRSLSEQEVGSRWSAGEPIEQTGPAKLVAALAELLNGERFASFAAWLRHPDVLRWLAAQRIFPLAAVDKYYNDYLPATWSEDFRGKADSMAESTFTACHGLLADLRGPDQPIAKWMPLIRKVLHTIYRQQTVRLDRESSRVRLDACQGIDEAIGSMSALPARLSFDVSASLALQLVGAAMAGERVGVPQTEDGIELLGWLELPLDAAPALIVTGFNEGLVPQSVTSDLFLPDRLRQHLGIHDNRQRYARDAYTLSVLLASRRSLHLISCQHDVHGDPLLPSRLLFCCDEEQRAARMLQFSEATTSGIEPNAPDPATSPLITTPLPDEEVPLPDSINVTDFKRYLRCPYQYYLERVLRLDRIDDQAQELVAHRFGTLIHTALERFGRSAAKDLGGSHEIYTAVEQELRGAAQAFFGFEPLPVVGVQVEQAMSRLKAFARQQALLRADGWEIVHVEEEGMDAMVEVEWMVDDHPFTIRGKIDRIDRHAESGAVRIIDYKTGDKGVDVRKLKDEQGQWTDLQLPLYRHLAARLGFEGPFEVAYFVLPQKTEQTGLLPVPCDDESLQQADELASEIIRKIRRREFWPPTEPLPPYSQDWKDLIVPA